MTSNIDKLDIVKYPNDILLIKCKSVEDFTYMDSLSKKMLELMKLHNGIGLAANQVGLDIRLFVMQISKTMKTPKICINPQIVYGCVPYEEEEGCLSHPGIHRKIVRNKYIVIKYFDVNGKLIESKMKDLEARCAQHEIDHLNGISFIDR